MLRRGLHVSKILKQSERFFSSTSAVEYPKQTVVRHAMNAAIKPVGASSEVNQFAVINLAGTQYKVTKVSQCHSLFLSIFLRISCF